MMEELGRIEARLESLTELGALVRALRSMAAARAREAQEALAGTRAYRGTIARAISRIAPMVPCAPNKPPSGPDPVRIVLTSENGFVGGFNGRIMDSAFDGHDKGERLIVVGRRGQVTLSERGGAPDRAVGMTARPGGVTVLARRIAASLGQVDRATLVFASPRTGAAFDVETRAVLPLQPPEAEAAAAPPLHHLPPAELLRDLAGEYLFAQLADALMQSLAAENGARLQVMDAASRSIDDRLETLHRQERAARQEQTTADMLDVVTGAEAVNGGQRPGMRRRPRVLTMQQREKAGP